MGPFFSLPLIRILSDARPWRHSKFNCIETLEICFGASLELKDPTPLPESRAEIPGEVLCIFILLGLVFWNSHSGETLWHPWNM